MLTAVENAKKVFSNPLYRSISHRGLIPRQRNVTFVYDLKQDLIVAVSFSDEAMKLMREFLQFNLQRTFLCATVASKEFLPKDDFMFFSIQSRELEWEEPSGYCLNPDIEYIRKSDKAALKTIFDNKETILKAQYLIDKCHSISGIMRYVSITNNYKETVKAAYPDNTDVQHIISRQYQHDNEILEFEKYYELYKNCVNIPL